MTCARCGFAMPADAWRCPSCAAPAGEPARGAVDCLAAVGRPGLPDGVPGEPVRLLGSLVVGGFGATVLLRLTDAVAAVKSAQAISDGDSDASSVGALRTTLGVIAVLVGLATVVAFFFWLRRVVRNAERFGLVRQRFNNGWTVGAWFVPVLGWWRPKQIVNDAWSGSGGGSRTLVDWWWGGFLISEWLVMVVSDNLVQRADNGGSLRGAFHFATFSDLLAAVVAALGLAVVLRLTTLQRAAIAD